MTMSSIFLLFLAMIVLAVIPGPGVLAVVAKSVSGGFKSGVATSIGIVLGDYVFILLAVYGLIAIAEAMGQLFIVVKYLGAAYLFYLGFQLIRQRVTSSTVSDTTPLTTPTSNHYLQDIAVGLLITLSNPKAILFYISFFPAFIQLSTLSMADVGIILIIASLAVGGVMVSYAFISSRAAQKIANGKTHNLLRYSAGSLLIGSGLFLAAKS